MSVPNGLNLKDVPAAKFYASEILRIAEEINTEVFDQMDRNQENLFEALQSENARQVSSVYEEMRKSFERYYNYLKESFDWINEATTQIESADKEIGQNFTDTIEQ